MFSQSKAKCPARCFIYLRTYDKSNSGPKIYPQRHSTKTRVARHGTPGHQTDAEGSCAQKRSFSGLRGYGADSNTSAFVICSECPRKKTEITSTPLPGLGSTFASQGTGIPKRWQRSSSSRQRSHSVLQIQPCVRFSTDSDPTFSEALGSGGGDVPLRSAGGAPGAGFKLKTSDTGQSTSTSQDVVFACGDGEKSPR